ncbi:MAG: rane protein [Bacillales bacterium]|jgi:putative Mn2+ efflux pump MntP|nr:rane protein [Bacillales bacterium]
MELHIAKVLSELFTLTLMAFALSLDAFSVSLGMGAAVARKKQIFKIGIFVGAFHVLMPLLGIILGNFIAIKFGAISSFISGALLLIIGIQIFYSAIKNDDKTYFSPVGFSLLVFAFTVSLDSFTVGLSLGILGAKTWLTLIIFGGMSCLLSWVGLLIGRKSRSMFGPITEMIGGSILILFAIKLILNNT